MREGVDDSRVGEVVGGHVDGLHGGDGAGGRTANAVLDLGQLAAQGGLIAEARGQLAHQRRDFGAGLHKAEDVVDQQQHVLPCVVAEVFGHGQRGVAHAEAGAGRLIHLTKDEYGIVEDVGLQHFAVQLFRLAAAFADAAEDADAFVLADHVMDHLGDEHGLAYAGAAEEAGLAAALQGRQHIDGLDAGGQDFERGGLLRQADGALVDRAIVFGCRRRLFVDDITEDVEDAPQHGSADRRAQRVTQIRDGRRRVPAPGWA